MSTLQLDIYRVVSLTFLGLAIVHLVLLYEIWRALKKKSPLDYLEIAQYFGLGLLSILIYIVAGNF